MEESSMEERMIIPYSGNTDKHLNWALGVVASKKRILKRKIKHIKSYSMIARRAFTYGIVLLIYDAIMLTLCLWIAYLGGTIPTVCTVIMTYFFCRSILLLYSSRAMKKQYQQIKKSRSKDVNGGKLVFDHFGIEDTDEDGKSMRLPWSEYEACIFVEDTIVLLMNGAFYFVPASSETEQGVRHALSHYRKEDTILDCRKAS